MRNILFALIATSILSTSASAQVVTPDAKNCEPTVVDSPLSFVAGGAMIFVFCAAAGFDAYAIWIDGEPITLTGALQQSTNMSTTGMREYFTPKFEKALAIGRHTFAALLGTFDKITGKTEYASAPSMPRTLLITAIDPPVDCTGQVRLSIGEAKPRVVVPQGEVEVTFSLRLSKVAVTSLEIRLNGTAVPSGLIGPAPDLRGLGSFRFQAPDAEGDYQISMLAFGDNGCSDGTNRYVPITVKK